MNLKKNLEKTESTIEYLSNKKGITLIVLAITIIILLILAGVSINSLTDKNGSIIEAQNAKQQAEEMALLEEIRIIVRSVADRNLSKPDIIEQEIQKQLDSIGSLKHQYAPIIRQKDQQYIDENGNKTYIKEGYTIVFGVHNSKAMFLDKKLKEIKIVDAIVGEPDDWKVLEEDIDFGLKTAVLTKYTGSLENVVIPNFVDGYLIVGLGDSIFQLKGNIKSVTFNEGLISIGDKAFAGCSNLAKISRLPTTLESIGESAFEGCFNLEATVDDLMIEGVKYGKNVFRDCAKVTGDISRAIEILIKDSSIIQEGTFSGMNSLTGRITIGSSIISIEKQAFEGCEKVEGIDIENAISLKEIGDKAFYQCKNMVGKLNFKENFQKLGNYAFYQCEKIEEVTLPNSMVAVNESCFENCYGLKKIILNCGDVFSGMFSFYFCKELQTVEFGQLCNMTYIPSYFFGQCISLKRIEFPSSIEEIKTSAFRGCDNLEEIIYSDNLKMIGYTAFEYCRKLVSLPIKNGAILPNLTTINAAAYSKCNNLGINFQDISFIELLSNSESLTTIGERAFEECQYLQGEYDKEILNKNNVAIAIGTDAFLGSSILRIRSFQLADATEIADYEFSGITRFKDDLTVIEIPDTVTKIGKNAFSGCTSITKVIIPSSVTSIGNGAFKNCNSLIEVENFSTVTEIPANAFLNCKKLQDVGNFNSLQKIGSSAFEYCSALDKFNFVEGLEEIESSAFYSSGITEVVLPTSLKSLGSMAFRECEKLQMVDCSKTQITNIPSQAFCYTSKLTTVALNSELTEIKSGAFSNTRLESIYIPDSVILIEKYALTKNYYLKAVEGCKSVQSVGEKNSGADWEPSNTFSNCPKLERVEGLSQIKTIAMNLFNGCTSLKELPDLQWQNITSIGTQAFFNCKSLTGTINLKNCSVASDAFFGKSEDLIINLY